MPKFAANLHYLFAEVPFLDRFEAAADAGFKGVEFQVPYDYPKGELAARLKGNGLQMVLFDAPMGNWDAGDRGLTAVPGREAEFRASLAKVADYGAALQCDTVHSMAGVVGPGQDYQAAERVYVENLRYAAGYLESQGMGRGGTNRRLARSIIPFCSTCWIPWAMPAGSAASTGPRAVLGLGSGGGISTGSVIKEPRSDEVSTNGGPNGPTVKAKR